MYFNQATLQKILGFLGAAFLPTMEVEQVALIAFPWEFLAADTHVFRKGSFGTVLMFYHNLILQNHEEAKGAANVNRDLDPVPHFVPFFLERFVGIGFCQFLLVRKAGPDLCDGFSLHLFLSAQPWDGADTPTSTARHGQAATSKSF